MAQEYRYMIYNSKAKEIQFTICEETEKGAMTCLYNLIGDDARKWRFRPIKLEKEKAKQKVREIKFDGRCRKLHGFLPHLTYDEIVRIVKVDEHRKDMGGRHG